MSRPRAASAPSSSRASTTSACRRAATPTTRSVRAKASPRSARSRPTPCRSCGAPGFVVEIDARLSVPSRRARSRVVRERRAGADGKDGWFSLELGVEIDGRSRRLCCRSSSTCSTTPSEDDDLRALERRAASLRAAPVRHRARHDPDGAASRAPSRGHRALSGRAHARARASRSRARARRRSRRSTTRSRRTARASAGRIRRARSTAAARSSGARRQSRRLPGFAPSCARISSRASRGCSTSRARRRRHPRRRHGPRQDAPDDRAPRDREGGGAPAKSSGAHRRADEPRRQLGARAREVRAAPARASCSTAPKRHAALRRSRDGATSSSRRYPILVRDEELLAKRAFHLVILDEAQTIKNTRSRRARALARDRRRAPRSA